MGVFSEMQVAGALAPQPEQEHIQPFSLEATETEENTADEPRDDDFEDDEEQQAEADAAPEVLAKLTEPSPDEKKKAHETAEAKRKAEWEAKHQEKEEAELMAWENAVALSDDELMTVSLKRIGTDAERITRRNMKMCVTEYIQTKCLEESDFARQVMHPRKNMINCFKYINHQALEFVKQEMADNEEKPTGDGYGSDVPDDLCYKWAEEYFMDMDAKEDKDKDDEFVPKPFYGGSSSSKSKKAAKAPTKKPEKKAVSQKEEKTPDGQLSFGSQTSLGEVVT